MSYNTIDMINSLKDDISDCSCLLIDILESKPSRFDEINITGEDYLNDKKKRLFEKTKNPNYYYLNKCLFIFIKNIDKVLIINNAFSLLSSFIAKDVHITETIDVYIDEYIKLSPVVKILKELIKTGNKIDKQNLIEYVCGYLIFRYLYLWSNIGKKFIILMIQKKLLSVLDGINCLW